MFWRKASGGYSRLIYGFPTVLGFQSKIVASNWNGGKLESELLLPPYTSLKPNLIGQGHLYEEK